MQEPPVSGGQSFNQQIEIDPEPSPVDQNNSHSNSANNWTAALAATIPALIFATVGAWALHRSGGAGASMPFTKSNFRATSRGQTGVKFDDVAGIEEVKAEVREIVDFLQNGDRYRQIGAKIPKGILLSGAPGTGKTLLAKAIAGEAGVPFYSIAGSEFVELYVGVGAARVRELFTKAERNAPCIIFIDELDAVGKTRSSGSPTGGNDEREQTLNQLLTEMDGFAPNSGVVVLAATNRPEILDPALKRPGRFDRQIVVNRPDQAGRLAILRVSAKGVKLSPAVDLTEMATQTAGFVGADLANLVNEAALLAVRAQRPTVTPTDFADALERVIAGLEQKSRVLNTMEKETVAYHEVGHAIVGSLMPGSQRVTKISIVPRGMGALGYTLQMPAEDRFLLTEPELHGQLATLLGGRAAEAIALGQISTGASDDIQKATDLAERAITTYGMSATLGPIAFDRQSSQFLSGEARQRRAVSAEVSGQIDREVQTLIDNAYQLAQAILHHNRSLLILMAQRLLSTEVLEGNELKEFLAQAQLPA